MRKNIIVGNWKMNLNRFEAVNLVSDVLKKANYIDKNIIFAPSFVYLKEVTDLCKNFENFSTSAQNCSHIERGSYTGEVSCEMISSLNTEYVIIGHSERRINYSENNSILKKKVEIALKNNLFVIFCCGESLEERKNSEHFNSIMQQLKQSLFDFSKEDLSRVIIAYEPIWAIGTGMNASNEEAQQMHNYIRKLINSKYGDQLSSSIHILYGGSCNPSNSRELFLQEDIDGGLIGGASLNSDSFISIINSV